MNKTFNAQLIRGEMMIEENIEITAEGIMVMMKDDTEREEK